MGKFKGNRTGRLKTWKEVKGWKDVLSDDERIIDREVLAKARADDLRICPHIREVVEDGEVQFVYCQAKIDRMKRTLADAGIPMPRQKSIPYFGEPRYSSYIECSVLQLFCIDNFENCIQYPAGDRRDSSLLV